MLTPIKNKNITTQSQSPGQLDETEFLELLKESRYVIDRLLLGLDEDWDKEGRRGGYTQHEWKMSCFRAKEVLDKLNAALGIDSFLNEYRKVLR